MPNIKSAKKRVKVNTTKAAANKARKSNLKTVIKNADAENSRGYQGSYQEGRSGLLKGSYAQE